MSLAQATALAPHIGYDQAAALSKRAYQEGRSIREVALESGLLEPDRLDKVLDLMAMTRPLEAPEGESGRRSEKTLN
jgi:fumarate hydratase class II